MLNKKVDIYIRENKLALGIIVVLVLAVVVSFFMVVNQKRRITDLQLRYATVRRNKSTPDSQKSRNYAQLKANQEALNAFYRKLPFVDQLTEKVSEINDILIHHAVTTNEIIFKPQYMDTVSLWKYTSTIKMQGGYRQLRTVLADIQNISDLFCIEKLSFIRNSKNKSEAELDLTLATYCRPYTE